jgi:hypothetical protein
MESRRETDGSGLCRAEYEAVILSLINEPWYVSFWLGKLFSAIRLR